MTAAAVRDFRQQVTAGEVIVLSVFEDGLGSWAKSWGDCTRVRVLFADAAEVFLEPEEFLALSREQQALVRHAPSR